MTDHRAQPIPPRTFWDSVKEYWPYATAIAVAGWAAFTWLADQRKVSENRRTEAHRQAQARIFEARKPFFDKQLQLYFETAQVVGKLVTLEPRSGEWLENAQRYRALYWSELSMVEHELVEVAMVRFGSVLDSYEKTGQSKQELQFRSYCLAHAIRDAIQVTWTLELGPSETPKAATAPDDLSCARAPVTK